ncbi:MAG: methionyl-tRNA formyltransferase [Synechococcales cyanobacterium CRU_2_2]|nr:methionyl-tRNA formyltransferase [Synechococcales cyanobacterium CRU_2_2]
MPINAPLRIVFFGTPEFAVPCLDALLQSDRIDVIGCVTQPDKRRGRGNQTTPSPVKALALAHGLRVWQPARIKKDPATLAQLEALKAEVFVVVAYGQILSQQILDMPRLGCVNVHGSLLPEYRGAAPIQWCIVEGKTETGVTTMQMDAGMDTGDMLQVVTLPIGPEETAWDVADRMAALGAKTLQETLVALASGAAIATPQDPAQATNAPLIRKEDYELDWCQGAIALHNRVRGLYPSCNSSFRQQPIKILETVPLAQPQLDWADATQAVFDLWEKVDWAEAEGDPGAIIALLKGWGPVVQTGQGPLLLRQVKPAGKQALSGWDFVNGLRVSLGETLGSA